MKKQTYEQWLMSIWKKWSPKMHLTVHDVDFKYRKETAYLDITFRYPYLDPTIRYSKESEEDWKKEPEKHEKRIVHEFCHIITEPLYAKSVARYVGKDEIEDERERLTDYIQVLLTNSL